MPRNVVALTNFGVVLLTSFHGILMFKTDFRSKIERDRAKAKIIPEQGIRVALCANRIEVILRAFLCSALLGVPILVKRAEAEGKRKEGKS
jgi:hypothetical protein